LETKKRKNDKVFEEYLIKKKKIEENQNKKISSSISNSPICPTKISKEVNDNNNNIKTTEIIKTKSAEQIIIKKEIIINKTPSPTSPIKKIVVEEENSKKQIFQGGNVIEETPIKQEIHENVDDELCSSVGPSSQQMVSSVNNSEDFSNCLRFFI
jgi:hypothetical protein